LVAARFTIVIRNRSIFRKTLLIFSFFLLSFSSLNGVELSTSTLPQMTVVFPREGAKIPFVKRSFVYGNVKPANSTLWINGSTVSVYHTGSFVGMIDFSTGVFPIVARSFLGESSTEVVRTVFVSSPSTPIVPDVFRVDSGRMDPSSLQKLSAVAKVGVEEAVLRTGHSIGGDSMGYDLFLPEGVPLSIDGQIGSEMRVFLSPTLRGWVPQSSLTGMGTGPLQGSVPIPRTILSSVHAYNHEDQLSIQFSLSSKVPYKVTLSEDLKSFKITFFYTISNLDRMHYDEKGLLKEARWMQSEENSVEVLCSLREKVWGYDIKYEGSQLQIQFKFFQNDEKTKKKRKKKKFLEGLKIAVDPGHSMRVGDGTVSPQGILEGEYSLKLALQLKEILEKSGAKVFLTRKNGTSVELDDRKKSAVGAKADLYLSLHANAVGYGADPLQRRGFSLFYFHPQSLELARCMSESFGKTLPLPNDGLYYGNLSVCRITQMPSILIETGYLIHPQDEELLLDEKFQFKIAESIVEGVQQFVLGWSQR